MLPKEDERLSAGLKTPKVRKRWALSDLTGHSQTSNKGNAKAVWEQTKQAAGLMIHVCFEPNDSLHRHGTTRKDFLYLGKLPLLVAKRTGTPCLEPALNAIQVKDMSTITPSNTQSRMISITSGVGLVLDTRLI